LIEPLAIHPRAMLALYIESPETTRSEIAEGHFKSLLGRWAKDDPLGALEWVRKNAGNYPDLITDYAKQSVIDRVALQDPKLAFTQPELEGLAGGLNHAVAESGEPGPWIDWIGRTLPSDKAESGIQEAVVSWTRNDYQAAGKWLASTPEGPAKNTAVRSYAETLSHYQPANAAQWAMCLRPGPDRDATLKMIYQNWPIEEPAAAAAFAKEHGIK
jgi:hypothetical protein